MAHLIPIPVLVAVVFLLIRAEFRQDLKAIFWYKPTATLLVILVGGLSLLGSNVDSTYTGWILAGLALSLVGDVALIFASQKAFLLGLIAFLLAHVVYAVVFTAFNGFHPADLYTGVVLLVIGLMVLRYLWGGLGRMKGPVILYVLVICVMAQRAMSTLFGDAFSVTQSWLIALGATFFWISDVILGVNRFGRPWKYHRISLAFYFAGQLLIALSASYSA